jgi:hypothetical protein
VRISCPRQSNLESIGEGTHPKRRKRIRAHLERRLDDPVEEPPEHAPPGRRARRVHVGEAARGRLAGALRGRLVVQDQRGDGVELERLAQHAAAGHGALAALVPAAQRDDDLRALADEVVDGQRLGGLVLLAAGAGGAVPEHIGEDELGVLAGFEGDLVDVGGEQVEEVFGEHEVDEVVDLVGAGFGICATAMLEMDGLGCLPRTCSALQYELHVGQFHGERFLSLRKVSQPRFIGEGMGLPAVGVGRWTTASGAALWHYGPRPTRLCSCSLGIETPWWKTAGLRGCGRFIVTGADRRWPCHNQPGTQGRDGSRVRRMSRQK